MDIYLGRQVVGQATVTVDGLYAMIKCICHFSSKKLYAVYIKDGTETKILGTCIPEEDKHILTVKLPKKHILKTNIILFAVEKYANQGNEMIALIPGAPIKSVGLLDHAFVQMNNGNLCLCIPHTAQEKESKLWDVNSMNS